jgi:hypothetical protein
MKWVAIKKYCVYKTIIYAVMLSFSAKFERLLKKIRQRE